MASADQISFRNLVGGQVVGPYGKKSKPNQPPKPAGAQRSVRARVGEGWAGIDARIIPKGGPPPRLPRQRLAKRKARKEKLVKFGLCPMTSECSTAYHVRKSQHSSARAPVGAAVTEQNSLEPRPAARQGASRARNCAAISVFSFDGSTAVFFLPPQKENGGGKPQAFACTPGWSTGPRHAVPRAWPPPTKFRAEIWGVGQVAPPYGRSTGPAAVQKVASLLKFSKFFLPLGVPWGKREEAFL